VENPALLCKTASSSSPSSVHVDTEQGQFFRIVKYIPCNLLKRLITFCLPLEIIEIIIVVVVVIVVVAVHNTDHIEDGVDSNDGEGEKAEQILGKDYSTAYNS
jgi:hypothetical protein